MWWELETGTFTWDSPKPLEPTTARAHVDSPGPEWNFPAGSLATEVAVKSDPRRGPRLGKKVQLPSVVRRPLLTAQKQNSFQMPEQIPRRRTQEAEHIFVYNERLLKLAPFLHSRIFSPAKALVG